VRGRLLLAIETSCDETGVALVEGGRRIHANVVASQVALHAGAGGVVPELAARAHLRWILPALDEAFGLAGVTWADVDGIAVTRGPGLIGSLLVGINVARTLAWIQDKPLAGVNHLEGHVYAAWLLDPGEAEREPPPFPLVALVVSGGHTFLVEMPSQGTYRLLGETVDDAAGEAFDKVGRLLGLGYPGGPEVSRVAEAATRRDVTFPRAWLGDSYDFSFSGLKTAARRRIEAARAEEGIADDPEARLSDASVAELAWGFEDSVVDVLATKAIRAADASHARALILGGGVAANRALRGRLARDAAKRGLELIVPRPGLCTDNGAMIGAAGELRLPLGAAGGREPFGPLDARPSLPLARA
jgi:N6-L-threonylcarbamoyladenine synthase